MRLLLSTLVVLLPCLFPLVLSAQTNEFKCNSTSSVSPDILRAAQEYDGHRGGTRYVQLKAIIAASSASGQVASTPSIVQRDIDGMNALFAQNNTGIQFELCGPVQTVYNYNLYVLWNFDPADLNPYYEPGYITLLYTAVLPSGIGGMNMGDLLYLSGHGSPQIAAHEMGHALGLMHTHDAGFGAELVDGSNCATAGDFVCDTPADPNLGTAGRIQRSDCTYIGTVLDANGDAYHPITNNIMSYSPCVLTTFTPGQVQVMQYVLDNVKTNLRVRDVPLAITPFDTRPCHNGGPLTLSATPGPGGFDGPLVSGTTLNNAPNIPGEYYVSYTPDATPDSSTFIDQAFTLYDQYSNYNYTYTVLDSLVQTITAGADGRLTQVDLLLHDPLPNNFRLRVYSGTGAGAVLLHESPLSLPAIADTSWISFPVADFVPMAAEAMYTLELVADHAFTQVTSFGADWTYYDYTRGSSNAGGFRDAAFRTWVHGLPLCGTAYRYYELYQVPPHYMLNLADAYCVSEVDTVWLIGDNRQAPDADIWIEGAHTSGFVPASLGEGAHQLQYINTAFGCTDTTISIITVTAPALSIPALSAPLCMGDGPFVLQGEPFGGYITVDGVRDSLLNTTALGIGPHMAQYFFDEVLDTVSFNDQAAGLGGYTSGAQDTVRAGIVLWQSFTPAFSGRLERLTIALYGMAGPFSYAVRLLHGTGPDGLLIGTDTVITSPGGSYPNMLGSMHPDVFRDSVYTLQFERIADTLSSGDLVYYYTDGTQYARGTGQFGTTEDIDFYFQQTVSHIYTCADSITVPFTVEVCTGVEELAEGSMLLGPNPFTEALTLNSSTDVRYALYNAVGAELLSGTAPGGSRTTLPTAHLAAGLYTMRCTALDGTGMQTVKVVKMR